LLTELLANRVFELLCDQVIIAVDIQANNSLMEVLEDKAQFLSAIREANESQKIMNAVHGAFHAIRLIC